MSEHNGATLSTLSCTMSKAKRALSASYLIRKLAHPCASQDA